MVPSCDNVPEFLLALQRILKFVQGLLELSLDLGEVVDLVFSALEVLSGLLVDFLHVLLLLVELVDEFVLVGDFIVQVADLVILGGLVLFGRLETEFQVLNVLLEAGDLLFQFLLVLEQLVAGIFLLGQAVLGVLLTESLRKSSASPRTRPEFKLKDDD